MTNNKLVYSTDPKEDINQKKSAPIESKIDPKSHCIKMRLETKSRGGKAVSVLFDLPQKNPKYLKALLKELKKKCASGGSLKTEGPTIEIQGDHRDKIRAYLEKKGFQVKG